MRLFMLALVMLAESRIAMADTLVAARTIRSQSILSPQDLFIKPTTVPGSFRAAEDVIGLETRVVLYAGRPIRPGDVGPAAVVERNQVITLIYARNGLTIAAEGRALGRAGVGESIRVMNLTSRATVFGRAAADRSVYVSQ